MLRRKNFRPGKRLTEESAQLFDKVVLEAMHGHRDLIDSLNAGERAAVLEWLSSAVVDGKVENSFWDTLWDVDYIRRPVSIETFLTDDYYLGKETANLHPLWMDDLKKVYAHNSRISEWIFTGAIGTGKSTIACAGMAYKLYLLSCLRNAPRYYGLLPGSLMVFGIYSLTKKQVNDTGYYKLKQFLDMSPFFKRDFPRDLLLDSKVVFQKTSLQVIPGCVAEGTMVQTAAGLRRVEDVAGCSVVTPATVEKDVHLVAIPGVRVLDAGMKACVELTTEGGIRLVCSREHPVHVVRKDGSNEWVAAKDLRVDGSEGVYVLPASATADGVLPSRRECAESVQVVHSQEEWEAVSRDQDVFRQGGAPARPTEGVPVLRGEEGPGELPPEVGPLSWVDQDCIAFLVQALRVEGPAGLLPDPHGGAESVRPREAFGIDPRGEIAGRGTLAEVLRGEQVYDSGTHVVTRRSFYFSRPVQAVAEEEPCEGQSGGAAVCGEVPSEATRTLAEVGKERTWAEVPQGRGATQGGAEEGSAGYAYAIGGRQGNGVLWRKVLLLWFRPIDHAAYAGPSCSDDSWRRHSGVEYSARVPEVQQQQEQPDGRGVHQDSVVALCERTEGVECRAEAATLCIDTVISVRDVGVRHCYDLVDVGPQRCYFANGILVSNSRSLHSMGLDLFSFLLDEVNFMKAKFDPETQQMSGQAYELYNSTHARLMSRYMRPGGTLPGMMFLVSSRGSKTAFLEERIKLASKLDSAHISDYALWDTKPRHRFILPHFNVEVGDKLASSRLLGIGTTARPGAHVVDVPGEFRRAFEEDLDRALRDIAGVATYNLSPLIRDRESVQDAVKGWLTSPFTTDKVTANLNDNTHLDSFFNREKVCRIENSQWVPRLNPGAPRCIHVDLSLRRDCAGIAMSHLGGMRRVKRLTVDGTDAGGTESEVSAPYVFTDFMLRIVPPVGSEIDLSKIRGFIVFLSKLYNVVSITFDGFQSADSRQLLVKQGLPATLLSVDRNDLPYLTLRNALFERRLAYYHYQPAINELLDLTHDIDRGKVDHPDKASDDGPGRKDVADALCGSVHGALNHEACTHYAGAVLIDEGYDLPENAKHIKDHKASQVLADGKATVDLTDPTPLNPVRVQWGDLRKNLTH